MRMSMVSGIRLSEPFETRPADGSRPRSIDDHRLGRPRVTEIRHNGPPAADLAQLNGWRIGGSRMVRARLSSKCVSSAGEKHRRSFARRLDLQRDGCSRA